MTDDKIRAACDKINIFGGDVEFTGITFKKLIEDYKIDHVDYLKIDCEGGEYSIFKEETSSLFEENKFEEVFDCSKGHPPVLKKFLSGKICIETLCIYDKIFLFGNKFDKQLLDPVWETVSLKIQKYNPFLNIDVFQFKRILREIINE